MAYFKGEASDNLINLHWRTYSELNSDHFVLEKRVGNDSFVELDKVSATGGTDQSTDYFSLDRAPGQGKNFYRLKQVDPDGTSNYSEVIMVECYGDPNHWMVYPNPTKESFQVYFSRLDVKSEKLIINLFDVSG